MVKLIDLKEGITTSQDIQFLSIHEKVKLIDLKEGITTHLPQREALLGSQS